ncbi:Dual specificity tyrosine-phosphorylation-regulated kinase 2 [Cichlidogyrus casuarinus]|uniref:dual-specificity kinase n=1 Tax=Cichlidogyrus casuarinus TaxID=1844966 RepID=A0ABD2PV45_9PLAT
MILVDYPRMELVEKRLPTHICLPQVEETMNRKRGSDSDDNNLNNENIDILSPKVALKKYHDSLSSAELTEILAYNKVYYLGQNANKPYFLKTAKTSPNYDDEDNFYRILPNDHLGFRYEIKSILGKGSFGQVVSAYDHKNKAFVAIKIVRSQQRFTNQAREEIRILNMLRDLSEAQNSSVPIVSLLNSFEFRGHACLTFELLSMNLYELIKKNSFCGLPRKTVKRISVDILQVSRFPGHH